jgi:hypothetical protein
MMAEPAYGGAEEPGSPAPADKHDPRARGWADVRLALISDSHVVALAAAAVAARPDDDAVRLLLGYALQSLESTVTIARRWVVDEATFAETHAAGYREGYEACKAQRCRLEVIPGGH